MALQQLVDEHGVAEHIDGKDARDAAAGQRVGLRATGATGVEHHRIDRSGEPGDGNAHRCRIGHIHQQDLENVAAGLRLECPFRRLGLCLVAAAQDDFLDTFQLGQLAGAFAP